MDVLKKTTVPFRPIPLTRDRALTELARSRRQLAAAVDSLGLATQILSRFSTAADGSPQAALEDLLGRIEEAEAILHTTTERLGSTVLSGRSEG